MKKNELLFQNPPFSSAAADTDIILQDFTTYEGMVFNSKQSQPITSWRRFFELPFCSKNLNSRFFLKEPIGILLYGFLP
mgnify:CR=1 FL=1